MKIIKGDILSVKEGIIVQQVNCQGVMGSGVAKAIRDKYPEVFLHYRAACDEAANPSELLGQSVVVHIPSDDHLLFVHNIFGQLNYGRDGAVYTNYQALDEGFKLVRECAEVMDLPVHYPKIGAGLGGGDWEIISEIIERNLDGIDHTLWLL